MSDDEEPPTRRDSGSLAIFEDTCREIVKRLREDESDEAERLREEAKLMVEIFVGWKKEPPLPEKRHPIISQVIELHRKVADYVSARAKPTDL